MDTSLGTLRFFDGLPDADTVRKVYDNLDLMRGVDVLLNTMSAASTLANIEGLKTGGRFTYPAGRDVPRHLRIGGRHPYRE